MQLSIESLNLILIHELESEVTSSGETRKAFTRRILIRSRIPIGTHFWTDQNMSTRSKRVAGFEAKVNQQRKQTIENKRQTERARPRTCDLCTRRARTRCRLCREYHKSLKSEESKLILCQGYPQQIDANKLIRWIVDQPLLAFWIEKNLELSIERGSLNTPARYMAIIGWKGGNNVDEYKVVEGLSGKDGLTWTRKRLPVNYMLSSTSLSSRSMA
jgi:hypothetical protein